jgi:hypothetical protein
VQSGIQSNAGNAYFVPTGAKCLQTQTEMMPGGRVLGRAEMSLYKLPPRCGRSDRTVCVRYSDTSAVFFRGRIQEGKQIADIAFN